MIRPFFLVELVLDPIRSLDLVDRQGQPDHGKAVPFLVTVAALILHAIGNPIPLGHLIVLVSAAFGYGSWRTFLNSRAATFNETRQTTHATTRTEVAHIEGDER